MQRDKQIDTLSTKALASEGAYPRPSRRRHHHRKDRDNWSIRAVHRASL